MSNVDDVRPVLDFYRNEDDVVAAFRRNQDALRKQQEEMLLQNQHQRSGGLFGRFFGKVSICFVKRTHEKVIFYGNLVC